MARKINAVEKAIANLDDVDKTIIQMKYFQHAENDIITAKVFLSQSAVYKRLGKAVDEMVYLIANTA